VPTLHSLWNKVLVNLIGPGRSKAHVIPSLVKSAYRNVAFGVRKLVRAGHLWCLYMYADNSLSSGLANLFWSRFICTHCLGVSQRTSDPEHGDGVGYRSTRLALPSVLDSSARNKRPARLMGLPVIAAFELKSGQQPLALELLTILVWWWFIGWR